MRFPKRPGVQVFGALVAVLLLTQCADPNAIPTNPPAEQTSPPTSVSRASPPAGITDVESDPLLPLPDASNPTLLTQRGIGELEVGPALSQADVEGYFDVGLTPKPQNEFCGLSINEDVGLAIVTDEYFATWAFIVDNPTVRTVEDIGVGSSYEDVLAAYGDSVDVLDYPSQTGGPIVAVDDLANPGAEFTFESRLMAFDTDPEGTVTRVRVGMYPWVTYTDYCAQDIVLRTHERTGWPLTRLVAP